MNSRLKYIVIIALIVAFVTCCASLEAKGKEQKIPGPAKKSLNGAKISMQQSNYPKALGQYLEVLKHMPNHVFSLREVAGLYFQMAETEAESVEDEVSKYQEANKYCVQAIATIESIPDWRSYEGFEEYHKTAQDMIQSIYARVFNLGKEMYDEEDFELAKFVFTELLTLDPKKPQAYQMLAGIAQEEGDEALKLDYLSRLGEVAKDNPNVLDLVASGYFIAKEYANALHYYQMYVELKPEDATGYSSIGEVYFDMENFSEAYKYFQKALELQPDNAAIVVNALILAQKMEDNAKIIEYATKLVEIDETKESLDTLCTMLIRNQDWQSFLPYGKKWYALDPENRDIVQLIIIAARQVKDTATEKEYGDIMKGM